MERLRLPLLRRRQLGRRHPASASSCCREKLLPKLNLFGYGQVESPYGSGEFYEYIDEAFERRAERGR